MLGILLVKPFILLHRSSKKWRDYGSASLDGGVVSFISEIIGYPIIGPFCSENILRFKLWVIDPDGTFEQHYERDQFTFEPVVELINLADQENPIELEMGYNGMTLLGFIPCDEYLIDLFGDGRNSYNWEKYDGEEVEFGPGAWAISFEVEDNSSNTDSLGAGYKIWHVGSWQHAWTTLFAGPSGGLQQDEDPTAQLFGYVMPFITIAGFIGAGVVSIYYRDTARYIAMGVAIADIVMKMIGIIRFMQTADTGALLGVWGNMFFTSLLYLYVLKVMNYFTLFTKTDIDFNQFQYAFLEIIGLIEFLYLLFINPVQALFIGLPLILMNIKSVRENTKLNYLVSGLLTVMTLFAGFFSLYESVDYEEGFLDMVLMPVVGLIGTAFGLGALLGVLGMHGSGGKFTPSTNPVQTIVGKFSLVMAGIAGFCLYQFLDKTGFFLIAFDFLHQTISKLQSGDEGILNMI